MRRLSVMSVVLIWAVSAAAQTITDGDTIKQNGTIYRLWGIDAPETKQACADGWRAGVEATKYIRELISRREVACEPRTTDRYGRTVALRLRSEEATVVKLYS